mmetsp:Transcript_21746/g.37074  ORF Transcript_21746/g.37074 Transcript_21746/m.37074 type:complete len:375 (+) Transcript_21746:316-1440(+)
MKEQLWQPDFPNDTPGFHKTSAGHANGGYSAVVGHSYHHSAGHRHLVQFKQTWNETEPKPAGISIPPDRILQTRHLAQTDQTATEPLQTGAPSTAQHRLTPTQWHQSLSGYGIPETLWPQPAHTLHPTQARGCPSASQEWPSRKGGPAKGSLLIRRVGVQRGHPLPPCQPPPLRDSKHRRVAAEVHTRPGLAPCLAVALVQWAPPRRPGAARASGRAQKAHIQATSRTAAVGTPGRAPAPAPAPALIRAVARLAEEHTWGDPGVRWDKSGGDGGHGAGAGTVQQVQGRAATPRSRMPPSTGPLRTPPLRWGTAHGWATCAVVCRSTTSTHRPSAPRSPADRGRPPAQRATRRVPVQRDANAHGRRCDLCDPPGM